MTGRRTLIIIAVACTLTSLALYGNVLHGDFVYDDFEYIVENPLVHNIGQLSMSDPRQVGYLSFAINYAIHGEDTLGYHLVNVLIHAANAFLVFLLMATFLAIAEDREQLDRKARLTAVLAAALFLVHPVQTQAVSYITQRFTSLTTLFYLLAVLLYLRGRMLLERGTSPDRGYVLYALAFLSAMLAMRTKEISFTIPFMLAAAEYFLFPQSTVGRRRYIYLIPFGVALLIIPLSLYGPELGILRPGEGIDEVTRQEKLFDLRHRSSYEYLLTQFRVIIIYLRLLLLPIDQTVVYDIKASTTILAPAVLGGLLLLVLLAASGWYAWHRVAKSRAPGTAAYQLAAGGIFWFFLTISVESSFIPIKDLIFEHRIYLPSAGLFATLSVLLVGAYDRHLRPWLGDRRAWIVVLVCVPFAVTTVIRNDVWTSELKLWNDAIIKSPNRPIGYNNRGTAYAKERQYELALQDMDRVIASFPKQFREMPRWEDSDLVPSNMSKTYQTRGRIYLALGDVERADADFRRARDIFMPPIDIGKTLAMGDLYYKRGAYRHAIEEFSKVLNVYPENIDALNNRGNAYSFSDRYDDAIRDFDQVIGLDPGFTLAYHNRGIALAWKGRKEQAVADFQKACSLGFRPACDSIAIAERGGK